MNFFKRYKNFILLIITTIAGISLAFYQPFHEFLLGLQAWGYLGAFIAGMLFVSTFTFATGAVILLVFAEGLNPFLLALVAGAGGVVGDILIFRFIRGDLSKEVSSIFHDIYELFHNKTHLDFGVPYFKRIIKTKYAAWTLPIVGALIVASPFPDELGITLMGISKMKQWEFLLLTFALNSLGVFLIISASTVVKP